MVDLPSFVVCSLSVEKQAENEPSGSCLRKVKTSRNLKNTETLTFMP